VKLSAVLTINRRYKLLVFTYRKLNRDFQLVTSMILNGVMLSFYVISPNSIVLGSYVIMVEVRLRPTHSATRI